MLCFSRLSPPSCLVVVCPLGPEQSRARTLPYVGSVWSCSTVMLTIVDLVTKSAGTSVQAQALRHYLLPVTSSCKYASAPFFSLLFIEGELHLTSQFYMVKRLSPFSASLEHFEPRALYLGGSKFLVTYCLPVGLQR